MRVRVLKRGVLWALQTGLVTGLAWYLLHWSYWDRLSDLVPYTIPTVHHLKMLFVAETLITGALAGGIALIFAARVERWPIAYAPGVMLCTCVALWAYVFVALYGDDGFEVNTIFLGGINYKFYCLIVVTWVGVVNGLLSLFAGALNAPPVVFREAFDAEPRRQRVRLVEAPVKVVAAAEEPAFAEGARAVKRDKAKKAKPTRRRG
jgi:hypothetical protein